MKEMIKYIATELDFRNEFSTKEIILYTILTAVCLVIACCGESIICSMF